MEDRVYQGHTYRRAGPGQPWQLVGPATPQGRVFTDPDKPREQARQNAADARADESQNIQRRNADLTASTNARNAATDRITNAQILRKEYGAMPEIKAYKVATQMAASALNTSDSPQGDLSLVYSFAKAMDPDSVVRDAESSMVTNTQPWFQAAVQNIKKQFGMDGAGSFTPEARQQLRQEILRSLATRKTLYDARRAEMGEHAEANSIPAFDVIGKDDTSLYANQLRSYGERVGDPTGVISGIIGGNPIKGGGGGGGLRPQTGDLRASGFGATTEKMAIPPAMQSAHNQYLAQNWGKLDPQDYAAFRVNLDKQYGFGTNPEGYATNAAEMNKMAATGASPEGLFIPGVERELSGVDQFRNNALSNPVGAGAATGLNAAGMGIPSLFAPEQTQALREEYPVSTFIGDVGGAVAGTGIAGAALRNVGGRMGTGAVAKALASPLAADVGYGAAYGATQADDPVYGALFGAGAGVLGNRVGKAAGRAFPAMAGKGAAVRAVDDTVPTPQALRDEASQVYRQAESTGEVISGPETLALNDRMSALLQQEGRLSPTGRVTEVQPKVKEAYQLASDYAGETMTPTQVQTVRSVIGDAVTSGDNAERRIARMLLNDFDEWTDGVAPEMAAGLAEGRKVASRYLQGDEIAMARELADARAGQFSNSGQGNALRTDFRQLDRKIARGQQSFSPPVEAAIADVSRGNPISNALRNVGRFAPTGAMSVMPYIAALSGGASAGSPLTAAATLGAAGLTYGARQLGQRMTNRSAQVAENLAYGGPEYDALLQAVLTDAANRGGHAGTALSTETARLLADKTGY